MIKQRKYNILVIVSFLFLFSFVETSCSSQKKITEIDNTEFTVIEDHKKDYSNKELYKEVESWLGTPYKYGGQTRNGTDCSGLVVEIYKAVYNKKLYRSSYNIYEKNCKPIQKKDLQEGDLVFFITTKNGKRINHVGLYLKDNKFIHSTTKRGVIITDLSENYYEKHFVAAGRVITN